MKSRKTEVGCLLLAHHNFCSGWMFRMCHILIQYYLKYETVKSVYLYIKKNKSLVKKEKLSQFSPVIHTFQLIPTIQQCNYIVFSIQRNPADYKKSLIWRISSFFSSSEWLLVTLTLTLQEFLTVFSLACFDSMKENSLLTWRNRHQNLTQCERPSPTTD